MGSNHKVIGFLMCSGINLVKGFIVVIYEIVAKPNIEQGFQSWVRPNQAEYTKRPALQLPGRYNVMATSM